MIIVTVRREMDMRKLKMYIDGKWVDSKSKEIITIFNPANYEPIAEVPRGNNEDVNQAVEAARKAFESQQWRDIKPYERGYILLEMAKRIRECKDELALLETLDVGKPLSQSYADVEAAARYFEFYGGVADKIMGETIPVEPGILDYTIREPLGVTVHIIPWNYPIQISSRSAAAAIAAGNTVVMKPAEDAPLTALKLAELFDEVNLPKGIFNVVTGFGHEAGAALVSHPNIDHVTFTGSVETGVSVMQAAAKNVIPVTLELGGKSPNIVFSDCDKEEALHWIVKSIVQNAGQTCSAGSRLIIEKSIKDSFIEALIERFKNITIGPGTEDFDIGPIISKKQFDRIQKFLLMAEREGKILVGGQQVIIPGNEKGYYVQPTIVDEVDPNSPLAQEEIFGPVLTVLTFESEEEAIQIANGTKFGLVTGIWTSDVKRAHRIAERIQSGQVFINNYGAGGGIQMPFGGYKRSGFGREKGLEALKNYTQLKNVALKYYD
jgi:aldehyde dehydrogenase (NAD+)